MRRSDAAQHLNQRESLITIKFKDLIGEPMLARGEIVGCSSAGEKPERKGAPYGDAEPVMRHHRDCVALHVAYHRRIVHLPMGEPRPAVSALHLDRRCRAPGGQV